MASPMQELIAVIRNQNGLLIGRNSAQSLYAFLSGFAYARKDMEGACDYQFLSDFGEWVRKRNKITATQSWAKVIEFYTTEESEELPLFWQLYDENLEQASRNGRRSKHRKKHHKRQQKKAV
jgi:hypothetical protein